MQVEQAQIVAQKQFIDDIIVAKTPNKRIFLCDATLLGHLTTVDTLGSFTPRIYGGDAACMPPINGTIAIKNTRGFEVYNTIPMHEQQITAWISFAKNRIYPFRFENDLYMAFLAEHYKQVSFRENFKLLGCCIDLTSSTDLGELRQEYGL